MNKNTKSNELNYRKKNRIKAARTVMQVIILLAFSVLLIKALFGIKSYEQPDKTQWTNKNGFIALSYFGVGRSGTSKLIAKNELDKQLGTLYKLGYKTISQQDVLDFYNEGKPLPEKALFLTFEDGRNDSSLFAQPILEKYNYKATMLSYADRFEEKDFKFLQPKDLLKLKKSGFWELGTNGYRLSYINIFDRNNNYIGMKSEAEFKDKDNAVYYDHYLMDFIRDEDMIPIENKKDMEARINWDYMKMEEVYNEKLGFMPQVYMIMHANSLYNGMNRLVEDVNSKNIQQKFKIHFNREGVSCNKGNGNLYDLTRLQPKAYWYTNHLLMKINKDTSQNLPFVIGDENRKDKWEVIKGAAEFIGNRIVLTSPVEDNGLLYLKDSNDYNNINITTRIGGNVIGRQGIFLRYDREKNSFINIAFQDNEVIVEEKAPMKEKKQIYSCKLKDIEINDESGLTQDKDVSSTYTKMQINDSKEANDKIIDIRKDRDIKIILNKNKLEIWMNKFLIAKDIPIDDNITTGGVALESRYSEINKKDRIYDGVFDDLKIQEIIEEKNGNSEMPILFYNGYSKSEKITRDIKIFFNSLVDWAIETF
ncbi:MAG: polysaccharide deacetylase family protein [Clostridium argentinense]|uniref:Polysaccharide deacetylase family protein n=1 Tax=Clostridium faecium TaxID=2762223 RepID=A0ABR8YTK0_9CLOT|nr:polysaccharide deacetylase family protein [Clostridium faecium]MBD8047593.1 polysaccharide deacetylase family protein [Clostridium faecium]MBS5824538.1 polysaccharide deacetylase family protein [Clostridium argentinense]